MRERFTRRSLSFRGSKPATAVASEPRSPEAELAARYFRSDARVQAQPRLHPDRGPAEGDRRPGRRDRSRRTLPDAAGGDRDRQDLHDGGDDRPGAAALAGDRPQQDPGGAALQRVPGVLPRQRGRVLRLLLRLLPAGGLRPGPGPLHREGLLDQRRDRPPAPRRDGGPVRPPRRDHRRLGLLHLRDRLAAGLQRKNAAVQGRRLARPRRGAAQAGEDAVPAQRPGAGPRLLPGPWRGAGDHARLRRVGLPDLPLRRRDRGDPALRPADRRNPRHDRPRLGLAGLALRDQRRDGRAGGRGDPGRTRIAHGRAGGRKASSWRPTGCASAPPTTSR